MGRKGNNPVNSRWIAGGRRVRFSTVTHGRPGASRVGGPSSVRACAASSASRRPARRCRDGFARVRGRPARRLRRAPRRPPTGRPWVLVNMVASIDGATAVDGRSGGLGGPGDKAVFHALRAVADVILVGAGTVRAEHYGPAAPRRRGPGPPACRGARPRCPGSRSSPAGSTSTSTAPLFTEADVRPLVVTADAARRSSTPGRSTAGPRWWSAGDERWTWPRRLRRLREPGAPGWCSARAGPA